MSQAEEMYLGELASKPADEITEKYWQLICQNRAFIAALRAAIRSGSETAAGVTATVRTGRKGEGKFVGQHQEV
jgi:hypothetical protein